MVFLIDFLGSGSSSFDPLKGGGSQPVKDPASHLKRLPQLSGEDSWVKGGRNKKDGNTFELTQSYTSKQTLN